MKSSRASPPAGTLTRRRSLIERYARLVRVCARPYFLAGGDSEDLTQEGLHGPARGGARLLGSERLALPRLRRGLHTQPDSTGRQIRVEKEARPAQRRSLPGICNPLRRRIRASGVYPARALPGALRRSRSSQRESEKEFYSTFSRCLSSFETEVLVPASWTD